MSTPTTLLQPALSPLGHLYLSAQPSPFAVASELDIRLQIAFARGPGHGLLCLGASEIGAVLPPSYAFWRDFSSQYIAALCHGLSTEESEGIAIAQLNPPSEADLARVIDRAPPMLGIENLNGAVLESLWLDIEHALRSELIDAQESLLQYLERKHISWRQVGRVHFNLAENPKDEDRPFAFIATYSTGLSANGTIRHQPLTQVIDEHSKTDNRRLLLSLLLPIQKAANTVPWVAAMVQAGEINHPIRWTAQEAYQFLQDTSVLEAAGIVVRMPVAWKSKRPARAEVHASVGDRDPGFLGQEALLDFNIQLSLGDEKVSAEELRSLMAGAEGLRLLRGQWVEVNHQKIDSILDRFSKMQQSTTKGIGFAQALRHLAGVDLGLEDAPLWSEIKAGPWLDGMLTELRTPSGLAQVDPGSAFIGVLKPWQKIGLQWLYLLHKLGLGACLADDMGLGKTIQMIALLLVLKEEDRLKGISSAPNLLVASGSLLGNWAKELKKFAPSLKIFIAHPAFTKNEALDSLTAEFLAGYDLVLTSYTLATRYPWVSSMRWRIGALDEAQAIKNPKLKQTHLLKTLHTWSRVVLTGTPVENRLSDLWSLFDFINPGLLGTHRQFLAFTRRLGVKHDYSALRALVRPYILRRLKTDPNIAKDLPGKIEKPVYCGLTARQAALYQLAVNDLKRDLQESEGIARRGKILASFIRFKQICNHASHWTGDTKWSEKDSGKFKRLRELAELIHEKQEKVLIFTQYREAVGPIAEFLSSVFGRKGLTMDGRVSPQKRQPLVDRFNQDERIPFFVISLGTGGAGLNLTAATHVIHFDRWWNPAKENQATDRAYRIGQLKGVLVHKFICSGTIEDRIDALIESKRVLVENVIDGTRTNLALTELSNKELLDLVSLDIYSAEMALAA